MLRRQSPNFDKSSFLDGTGEMATRIRQFDWSGHPFGPPKDWPVALRSALGIALNSAFPACIYWGSDLRLLYNDAWSHIPGPRHPACLGQPAEEVWADIWHIIEPQFTQAISTGSGVFFQDQMLPMRRFGVEEETYWTYNFTPIRGDDGSIGGIFNTGSETTRQVLQQKSTGFLLELSDMFRHVTDAPAGRSSALEMLGRHLSADRVGVRELQPGGSGASLPVVEVWATPDMAPLDDAVRDAPIDGTAWTDLLDGHVIRLDGTDTNRADVEASVLAALGCAAALAVPWVEDGRTQAILFVHSRRERHWSDMEVETVESVLSRLMHLIERARAAERERLMSNEINHRARNLLSVVQAIVRLARAEDPDIMRAKLIDRFSALAKSHFLLSDRKWETVTLEQMLKQELAPYIGGSNSDVTLSGPEVALSPVECTSVGMVLHELATNAAKYGALNGDGGRLTVTWTLSDYRQMRLDWIESSATPIDVGAGSDKGFGSTLLTLMIERQLEGTLIHDLRPEGLHCVIEVPLKAHDVMVADRF
ncbi:histidine kinase [Oceanicola sp. 22II-s10i]|uniref:HWE histidine kinase domain-containing protein n=1 Tax=Oceanicola sp. 22II-s10i TaxID=1317116 RepID=UPI000B694ECD|nr:HWE histidine kinase domain-containing protein [Oceanicola sp. 22II-s10i]OWU84676.1 histidine kinase [Oceanicola sp. 22II-s10i]